MCNGEMNLDFFPRDGAGEAGGGGGDEPSRVIFKC